MQENVIGKLTSTLRSRLDQYEELIALAQEQQSILVEGRHTDLSENLAKHDPILLQLKQLEKRQEGLLVYLVTEGTVPGSVRPGDFDSECRRLEESISRRAQELRELTETNKQLINNAMNFRHFSMNVICKAAGDANSAPPGASPAIMLDLRV